MLDCPRLFDAYNSIIKQARNTLSRIFSVVKINAKMKMYFDYICRKEEKVEDL